MTDEYKERIIKWLTGNYEIEQSSTDPLFQDLNEATTNINTYIDVIQGFVQGKDGKGNDLNIGFIYGLDTNNKGVIIIVDNKFNIIQVINEYNTGTAFNEWIYLNIDNTNGNIYGIDKQGSQYRFILLNNFMMKTPAQENYEVKLRNDYLIALTQVPQFVEKRPSDSFYVITGIKNNKPAVATYKIEVGSTNELIEYDYTGDSNTYLLKANNISWSGEEYIERIGCYYANLDQYNFLQIKYVEFSFNGTTISKTKTIDLEETYLTQSMLNGYMSMVMTNTDTYICYPLHLDSYNEAHSTVILKIQNNTYITFYELETDASLDYTYSRGKILKINNQIYFYAFTNTDSPQDNTTAKYKIEFGTIGYLNNLPYITKKAFDNLQIYNLIMFTTVFYVFKSYNLISYNLCGSNSNVLLSANQIFNILNYNYDDYQDTNSMVPNSVWLYNNNEIIYARNLYNKVVSGNTTTSTLEVPNLLLNDIDIEQQDLLGQTNGVLVSNIETIQKNIYEDLYINFYNTLTMQNQNTQEYITNIVGASRLNGSISSWSEDNEYNDVKLTKIRINYSDDTSLVKAINPATRISQFVYQYSFNIYVPGTKDIVNIELISQDEGTVYQTITGLNLENSKSYKITQNVEIGE